MVVAVVAVAARHGVAGAAHVDWVEVLVLAGDVAVTAVTMVKITRFAHELLTSFFQEMKSLNIGVGVPFLCNQY